MCGKYIPVFYMCILINYLSVDVLADDSVPYWYVWKTFNWTEAYRYCESANGSLVHITDQNYMQIRQCVGTSRAWTGAHTKLHPENYSWIEHIGCFNSSLKEDSPENTILPNSPQQCGVNCRDGRFFAVQENKCFCLNGSANTWNEFRKRAGNCTYICNGNSKYFCGGSDSVNIYGHVSDVKINNQRLECIFTECVGENGTFGWNKSEQSCSTSNRSITTICDDGTFVTNTSSATDNDSRKWCSKRKAYLWSPGTGILDCNNSTIHEAINGTWIRINTFMSLSLRWNFTDGSKQFNPLKCFTLMSSGINSVLKEEDCVEKFNFICQAVTAPKNSSSCENIADDKNDTEGNYTDPSSTEPNYADPSSTEQSYTEPSSTYQTYNVLNTTESFQTSTRQSNAITNSTYQNNFINSTTENYTVSNSTYKSNIVTPSTEHNNTDPNSTEQSFTLTYSTDKSHTLPVSTQESYTQPSSTPKSYNESSSTSQNSTEGTYTIQIGTDTTNDFTTSTDSSNSDYSSTYTLLNGTNGDQNLSSNAIRSTTTPYYPTNSENENNDTAVKSTSPPVLAMSEANFLSDAIGMIIGACVAVVATFVVIIIIAYIVKRKKSVQKFDTHAETFRCFPEWKWNVAQMENNEAAFQSTRNGPEQLHQEIDENIAPSMVASILNQQFGSDLSTIPETEEEDAYTLAFPGEYDQLGNISKRHMNWNKGADNIFSHTLFASDPNDMYDT